MDTVNNFTNKKGTCPGSKENAQSQDNVILTSRARIARNLNGFKFSSQNTNDDKKKILGLVKQAFFQSANTNKYIFYNISRLSRLQRGFLLEKHVLSPEMLFKLFAKGLILKSRPSDFSQSTSILINEEDHLRIQCIISGLDIHKAYSEISVVEKMMEKKLKFCYEKDLGFLTSCPTNLGTGLMVSVIVHIPAVVISGKIDELVKKLSKIGCNISGFFGENSDVMGNLFQISNQSSLGRYEKQVIDEMNAICLNIIDEENSVKKSLKNSMPLFVEDSIMRSYGMLKYAKLLSYGEALELISMISLGKDLGILKDVKNFNFYQLISLLGESNIILAENVNAEPQSDQVDKIRAEIVKNKTLKRN